MLPAGDPVVRPGRDGLAWFFASAFLAAWRILRRQRYDFVMTGSALLLPLAYPLGRLFNCRVVVQIHGLDVIYDRAGYRQMIRLLLPRCDLIFANSQESKSLAVQRGVAASIVRVINPGIHVKEFEPVEDVTALRRKLELNDCRVILSVGRLAARKGIAEFVRFVMPAVIRQYPNLLFVVVGGNPIESLAHKEDVRLQIETAVSESNLKEHVRLLGKIDRETLVHLYHVCDLFVLPAIDIPGDMEGFGIVLLEASAAGKPVVSVRLGGIPDATVHGQSGFLLEAGAWSQMAETIIKLLGDDAQREALGAFGRSRAQQSFDWQQIGYRYFEELQNECGS
jgi:phosphatidyl-myo-inositol dimannoside synthase